MQLRVSGAIVNPVTTRTLTALCAAFVFYYKVNIIHLLYTISPIWSRSKQRLRKVELVTQGWPAHKRPGLDPHSCLSHCVLSPGSQPCCYHHFIESHIWGICRPEEGFQHGREGREGGRCLTWRCSPIPTRFLYQPVVSACKCVQRQTQSDQ